MKSLKNNGLTVEIGVKHIDFLMGRTNFDERVGLVKISLKITFNVIYI